jgi:hypothetical protein
MSSSTIVDSYGLAAYWSWHHHRVGPASPRGRHPLVTTSRLRERPRRPLPRVT